MNPGPELDRLVAEKVMGWKRAKIDWQNPRPYQCSKCSGTEYFISGKDRRRVCKPCHKSAGEKWRKANPTKHNQRARTPEGKKRLAKYRKNWALRTRYGITFDQYKSMSDAQGGVCLICKGNQSRHRPLVVDHCHKTGQIRGLLCDPCNIGLANFRDNAESLKNAVAYLSTAPHAICLAALMTVGVEV